MKLDDILAWLRSIAPEETAFAGDPVGLLVQPGVEDVATVAVCLDARPDVIRAAADAGASLIVCHHPLIYAPMRRVDVTDPIGGCVVDLIRSGIALYAMHTNWDRAAGGINATLAAKIGLLDITQIDDPGEAGIVRIGSLPQPMTVADFAAHVADALVTTGESALRYAPQFAGNIVRRIAVCGGAGAFLMNDAVAAGADAYVTADIRHHEFVEASSRGIVLFDAGHGATERPGMAALAEMLRGQFSELNVTFVP